MQWILGITYLGLCIYAALLMKRVSSEERFLCWLWYNQGRRLWKWYRSRNLLSIFNQYKINDTSGHQRICWLVLRHSLRESSSPRLFMASAFSTEGRTASRFSSPHTPGHYLRPCTNEGSTGILRYPWPPEVGFSDRSRQLKVLSRHVWARSWSTENPFLY